MMCSLTSLCIHVYVPSLLHEKMLEEFQALSLVHLNRSAAAAAAATAFSASAAVSKSVPERANEKKKNEKKNKKGMMMDLVGYTAEFRQGKQKKEGKGKGKEKGRI